MKINKHSQKKDEVEGFEVFRKMSLKEKFIHYLGFTFVTIVLANISYISTHIINNKDILLSEMLLITMYCPFGAAIILILFVYFFEPMKKRLRERS